jgi:hypothetical protein
VLAAQLKLKGVERGVAFHPKVAGGTSSVLRQPPVSDNQFEISHKKSLFHWLFNRFSRARSVDDQPIDVGGIGIGQF